MWSVIFKCGWIGQTIQLDVQIISSTKYHATSSYKNYLLDLKGQIMILSGPSLIISQGTYVRGEGSFISVALGVLPEDEETQ